MVELGQDGIPRKVRGYIPGFDVPFNPLRVNGAHVRGRKERNTESKDDSDGASLAAMQELLGGLPRMPQGGASSNTAFVALRLIGNGFLMSPSL
ncbi:hypothetical protein HAX54_032970 [Datura stramonium]|uniref:Uncharacterized protein n=1 Tax=Datura stramonium TaxID=4076 RepID=A0ABS8VD26_DATST|nr:hypothetical protein [Datura stramonium]